MAEVERVKPRSMYIDEAVQLALANHWDEALAINLSILERFGDDEDTYNRLGKAHLELGHLAEALSAYSKAMELNPLNIIAQKNARRLQQIIESKERLTRSAGTIDVDLFAEEPGKSGFTVLMPTLESSDVLVNPGDVVELQPEGKRLLAETAEKEVLGEVEPKLAHRLLELMATGNRYTAAVARATEKKVEIIIRELYQSPENSRKSSFPVAKTSKREGFRPYAKESLLSQRGTDEETESDLVDEAEETDVEEESGLDGMQELDDEFEPVVAEDIDEDLEEEPDDDDDETEADDEERPEDSY